MGRLLRLASTVVADHVADTRQRGDALQLLLQATVATLAGAYAGFPPQFGDHQCILITTRAHVDSAYQSVPLQ